MTNQRFDYVDQELSRNIEEMVQRAATIDTNTVNLTNGVKQFLKTDQFKIVVADPSVAGAEKQMKGVAAFFNDKINLLTETKNTNLKCEEEMDVLIEKLTTGGHISKAQKVKDGLEVVQSHKEVIDELLAQLLVAKRLQLNELKKKILKTERVKHFKHLH